MPTLGPFDLIIADPPYGEKMGYEGDSSLDEAEGLLCDMLRLAEPKLKRNGHVVIFWTMRCLDVCIDAVRSCGFTYRRTCSMYLPKGSARPYLGWLPRTQAIVVAQKYLPKQPSEFHQDMAEYLAEAVEKHGKTRAEIATALNCNSRLVMKWTRTGDPAWCLPTPRFYNPLKKLLNLDDRFDILLTREPFATRKDFEYKHDTYVVDKLNEKMEHPSQKPLAVMEHVVSCVCPVGGIVLDPFCGSGSTLVAAEKMGRRWIGFEKDAVHAETARKRTEFAKQEGSGIISKKNNEHENLFE